VQGGGAHPRFFSSRAPFDDPREGPRSGIEVPRRTAGSRLSVSRRARIGSALIQCPSPLPLRRPPAAVHPTSSRGDGVLFMSSYPWLGRARADRLPGYPAGIGRWSVTSDRSIGCQGMRRSSSQPDDFADPRVNPSIIDVSNQPIDVSFGRGSCLSAGARLLRFRRLRVAGRGIAA
jgi:hypothetical protein